MSTRSGVAKRVIAVAAAVALSAAAALTVRSVLAAYPDPSAELVLGGHKVRLTLSNDPVTVERASQLNVTVEPHRQCLELREGISIPMRHCSEPATNGLLRFAGAALFDDGDGSVPTLIVTAVVDDSVETASLEAADEPAASQSPVELSHDGGHVIALQLPCADMSVCHPELQLVGADLQTRYSISVDGLFGNFEPLGA